MTIFTMKGGKIEPIAVIKEGKTIPIAEFIAAMVRLPRHLLSRQRPRPSRPRMRRRKR